MSNITLQAKKSTLESDGRRTVEEIHSTDNAAHVYIAGSEGTSGMAGIEVEEVANVTNTQGTLVFSGLKTARMFLKDTGSAAVVIVYYVINADTDIEAAAQLALAGSRLIINMGETIEDLQFDSDDPVTRIDYIASGAESGANLLYIEGRV